MIIMMSMLAITKQFSQVQQERRTFGDAWSLDPSRWSRWIHPHLWLPRFQRGFSGGFFILIIIIITIILTIILLIIITIIIIIHAVNWSRRRSSGLGDREHYLGRLYGRAVRAHPYQGYFFIEHLHHHHHHHLERLHGRAFCAQ